MRCVALASCFSLNNWALKPFFVDCIILCCEDMGSESCSVKSANPSEFQLDTTDCYVCCTGEMVACILQFIEEGSWNIEQFYLITLTNIDFDQSKTK